MRNKISDLILTVNILNLDIIILSETWLKISIPNNFIIKGFNIFRRDRTRRGEGVLIAFKKVYKVIRKNIFESQELERLAVELRFKGMAIFIITIYFPPNSDINILDELKFMFEKIERHETQYKSIILCGDLNIDFSLNCLNTKRFCERPIK